MWEKVRDEPDESRFAVRSETDFPVTLARAQATILAPLIRRICPEADQPVRTSHLVHLDLQAKEDAREQEKALALTEAALDYRAK